MAGVISPLGLSRRISSRPAAAHRAFRQVFAHFDHADRLERAKIPSGQQERASPAGLRPGRRSDAASWRSIGNFTDATAPRTQL